MNAMDLSILKKIPNLEVKAELIIEPLAPLSMVSELPGSFYKTMKYPSKKMICGLIENILGWHIDWKDRKMIQEEVVKVKKKQKVECLNYSNGSTYVPLLIDYFELIEEINIEFSEVCFFDDLWSRSYRRADSYKHINGCRYMDVSMVSRWNEIKRAVENNTNKKWTSKRKNTLLDKLFNRYIGKFPQYYSTPTIREYIHLGKAYHISLLMDEVLFTMLSRELNTSNIGYLGNSEGWINLKLIKL